MQYYFPSQRKLHVNGNLASLRMLHAPPTSASLFCFYYSDKWDTLFYCYCLSDSVNNLEQNGVIALKTLCKTKINKCSKEYYLNVIKISLFSSFLTGIGAGRNAPLQRILAWILGGHTSFQSLRRCWGPRPSCTARQNYSPERGIGFNYQFNWKKK